MDEQLNQTKLSSDLQPNLQSTSDKKPHLPWWIVVLLIVVATVAIGLAIYESYQYFISREISTPGENEEIFSGKTMECQKDWLPYSHDVIGIKFCYPSSWGESSTEPKKAVTRLGDVVNEFTDEHNSYHNSIYINFTKNQDIGLHFFNEQYGGEYYPNAYAYSAGHSDNIPELKSTGDICQYKIDFNKDWLYQGKLNEIYNQCDKDIKTTIIEHTQYFDKTLYTYNLKSFAYKKLTNGYFDNLLITFDFGRTKQITEQLSTFDEFLIKAEKLKEKFEKKKKEFKNFIDSIQIYQPIIEKSEEFEIIEGENPQITIIRKYYWLLSNNKLTEAYELRADKNKVSYEDFQSWYKNIRNAVPYDFKEVDNNTYEFYVGYQDHNTPETKFRVTMSVSDDRLTTLSSDEILSEQVKFGEYLAYIIKRNNKNYVILEKNKEETIVDEGYADYDLKYTNLADVKFFHNPRFSPKGNYLTYQMSGWEWSSKYVYDIKEKKRVLEISGAYEGFDFTPNENYFYTCSSPGMASDRVGLVYAVPGFSIEYDVNASAENQNYFNINCRYDENAKMVIFTLSGMNITEGYDESKKKEIRYLLEEKRVEVIE